MKPTWKYRKYIWQLPDWPHFTWDISRIEKPLCKLNRRHGELVGKMSMLGFREKTNSMVSALSSELLNSSEIEGMQLNPKSVRSSIARRLGLVESNMIAEDHYVEGLVDVMMDAVNNCREPLKAERLFNWHAALFPTGRSGMHPITVAHWRKGEEPMRVVSGAIGRENVHFEAPRSDLVLALMKDFFEWSLNSDVSPFLQAAVSHLWFVTIHPFDDGNGRISRTISDYFLSRLDDEPTRYYSISAQINKEKKAYYEILEKAQKGSMDITEWLLWFFQCVENAIADALDAISTTLEKANFWEKFRDVEINERQRKIINRLWDGFDGHLTSSKWAKICHCSQDTALRDINDLLAKGLLVKSASSGRSSHYMLSS